MGNGAAQKDTTVQQEVGFLLLAEALQMLRDFHKAYLKDK